MKLNKIVLGLSFAMSIASFANAADQGHGTVTFTGSIIDAPCSIDPDTIDQTVNLGQVSNVALLDKGASAPKYFEIRLENCSILEDKANTVTATFSGATGGTDGMLGMTGTAAGASIAMADMSGKLIKLGTATAAQAVSVGNNTLGFTAYLQGDGASEGITPGDFKSVANFTLAYQ
ncbi:type 1 fimbrial protein [Rahnella sp. FC061912-K]|uniref:fimbrial protein n=1 Tax=Rahnella rivi TaxID=2816249 RepID=UPI001C2660A8|nr:fimbrial protein [Rahnella rivi]MBU9828520.1 type 1 fimbrial protein [Rahnella rivi]